MAAEGTVTVQHPDRGTFDVTPEVANALLGKNVGWTRDGAAEARIAELEAELAELKGEAPADNGQADGGMPDKADDLKDWIGDDPERAQAAGEAEAQRDKPRKTVTDHIESVLNPTPNDPADNGQED